MIDRRGFTVWFTGLSGAGKSTLATALASVLTSELAGRGLKVEILDGDEVRTNLSKGLGFSREDRDTNIRRIGYVARLLARNGAGVIAAAISPYREVRAEVRQSIESDGAAFIEVFVKCPLDVLVERDVKGLYKRALAGEIKEFTGVSDPYEAPVAADETVEVSIRKIIQELARRGFVSLVQESALQIEVEIDEVFEAA